MVFAKLLVIVAAAGALPAFAQSADDQPLRVMDNGWVFGEAGNNCVARFARPDGSYAMMALTKWDDLSDAILYWRPGLEPMADPEPADNAPEAILDAWDEAAGSGWGVRLTIDGESVDIQTLTRDAQSIEDPDRLVYRVGIFQQDFLEALATGETLAITRNGDIVDSFAISGSADLATVLRNCVDKDPDY